MLNYLYNIRNKSIINNNFSYIINIFCDLETIIIIDNCDLFAAFEGGGGDFLAQRERERDGDSPHLYL